MNTYIRLDEFTRMILEFITSEEYKDFTKHMNSPHMEEFEQGFIQGLCWSSILTCQMRQFVIDEKDVRKQI